MVSTLNLESEPYMEASTKKIWISPSILDGKAYFVYFDEPRTDDWRKAYQMWAHANDLMKFSDDSSYRVDVISTLKRAIYHRFSILDGIYQFKSIPIRKEFKYKLEPLEFWGITRPTMTKKLVDLRNLLEHEYETPPDHDRCLEFVDFVWYFLKSTDSLAQKCGFLLSITNTDKSIHTSIEIEFGEYWYLSARGHCLKTDLSQTEVNDWICIDTDDIKTRSHRKVWEELEREGNIPRINPEELAQYAIQRKDSDYLGFSGQIIGNENILRRIFHLYFSLG